MSGKFITFEGNDGCGKSTVSQRIFEALKEEGYDVILTREPGGIAISEAIREVILDPQNTAMDGRTEALLYAAARRQHLVEKILPALHNNTIVLCDRFIDSSLAYQGVARGLGMDEVMALNEFAIDGHMPDATLFLQVPSEVGRARIKARGGSDRLDLEGVTFHEAVANGYEQVCARYPQRIHIVDANQPIDKVFEQSYAWVKEWIQ